MVPAVREGILYGLAKQALLMDGSDVKAQVQKKGAVVAFGSTSKEVPWTFSRRRDSWAAGPRECGNCRTIMVFWACGHELPDQRYRALRTNRGFCRFVRVLYERASSEGNRRDDVSTCSCATSTQVVRTHPSQITP